MWFLERLKKANGRPVGIVLAVVIIAYIGVMTFGIQKSMTYTTSDSALTISYKSLVSSQKSFVVQYADIHQVLLYQQAPPMRKVYGSNAGKTRIGTYATDELGSFQAAVNDVTRPLLYVKAGDQAYMISPDDAAGLKQLIESKMIK